MSDRIRSRTRVGFTLVELLVVIGIIAVLISLLLPALNRARQSANSVACLSNLRQIGTSLQMYMGSFKGHLMPVTYSGTGQSYYNKDWPATLVSTKMLTTDLSGAPRGVFICPSGTNDIAQASYGVTPASQTSDLGYVVFPGADGTQNIACNYAVNGNLSSGGASRYWDPTLTKPYSEFFPFVYWNNSVTAPLQTPRASSMYGIKDSTRMALVFDGLWAHGLDYRRFTLRHGNLKTTNAAYRSCNFAFMDGHAEAILGSNIPGPTDNMYDNNVMSTDNNGKWGIKLLTKPAP